MRSAAAILALVLSASIAALSQATPVTIYVGPQTRDGFVDVDSGIMDSIKDVSDELRKDRQLRIVDTPDKATLVLRIVGRRSGEGAGAVAIPAGAVTSYLSVQGRLIDARMQVGTYERTWTAEDRDSGTWTAVARVLAKDVKTWIAANRSKLP